MKKYGTRLGLPIVAIATFAIPSAATAEYLVPPENSAATQYTEALPTAGGPKDSGRRGQKTNRSPTKVLGTRNTQRLEEQGPAGHAVAAIAADTAPSTVAQPPVEQKADQKPSGGHPDNTPQPAPYGARPQADQPSGSSGLGEAIAHATGFSSSGGMGLLLPLLILGALVWAVSYWARQRKRPAA